MSKSPVASPSTSSADSGVEDGKHPCNKRLFLVPSPIITRRTRTSSMSKSAAEGDTKHGIIVEFSKGKGHGFIQPDTVEEGNPHNLFVHVSDVESDYVPQPGDGVTYKEFPIPPQNVQVQAVHVQITHMSPDHTHHRWEDPEKTS